MNCAHPPSCECAECLALLAACERALAGPSFDVLDALHDELGDALLELPDHVTERLLWWRATNPRDGLGC